MGKLRLEAKAKAMDPKRYKDTLRILVEARQAARDSKVYWDLDSSEKAGDIRKEFLYVARKEGLPIKIRQLRKKHSLAMEFPQPKDERVRMTKDEYKRRIIRALEQAARPLKKSEVIESAEVPASTWNLRIQELLKSGEIKKKGTRSETIYSLKAIK